MKQLLKNMYKHILYHRFRNINFRRLDESKIVIDWLDAKVNERILDVGCGEGYYDWLIAQKGAHVVGIDSDGKRLRDALFYNKTANTKFICADAERLSFADGAFAGVVSFCVIEHLDNDDNTISEIHRVLKPGGIFVVSADSLSSIWISQLEQDKHRRRYNVKNYYQIKNLKEKLQRCGFEIIQARYIMTSWVSVFLAKWSYKLDNFEAPLNILKLLGYLWLATLGRVLAILSEKYFAKSDEGLTVIVKAKKFGGFDI